MIQIKQLYRSFGPVVAVDGVSFDVGRGEVLGFLGPNGAGKTTVMRMLACFLAPDKGTASVCGYDILKNPVEVRRSLGYLAENVPAYGEMTVGGILDFVCDARQIKGARRKAALDRVVPMCAIDSVTVISPEQTYTIGRNDSGELLLDKLPQGKKLKTTECEKVFTALMPLRFDDVKAAASMKQQPNFDRRFICRLKDSTVYTLLIAGDAGKTYVTCQADFADKTPVTKKVGEFESEEKLKKKEALLLARGQAESFTRQHQSWIYEIPQYKAKSLTTDLSGLTEDLPEGQAQKKTEPNTQPELPAGAPDPNTSELLESVGIEAGTPD